MATDDDIEREILAKGLTAPRVTPDSIVTASAKHDAAPMAQLVDQFLNQPKPPLGATVGVE